MSDRLREILSKFEDYCDCEEYHYSEIDGDPGNHNPDDGHMEFDLDKTEAAIKAYIRDEIIGEDQWPDNDDDYRAFYENELRAEQRSKL